MTFLLVPLATALSACAPVQEDTATVSSPTYSVVSAPLPVSQHDSARNYVLYDERAATASPYYWSIGASIVTTRPSDGPDEDIDFNEGWGVQVAFGRRYHGSNDDGMAFDLEIEGLYTDQESDDDRAVRAIDDLNTAGALVNALAAFDVAEKAELFVGAGLGVSWLDVGTQSDSLSSFEDEDGPFLTWQLRAGVRFDVSEAASLEVGYRFLNIDDAEVDDGLGDSDFQLQTEQHTLGVSVRFGH